MYPDQDYTIHQTMQSKARVCRLLPTTDVSHLQLLITKGFHRQLLNWAVALRAASLGWVVNLEAEGLQ